MKCKWLALSLISMMSLGNVSVYAQQEPLSIHQITYTTPISLAEMMITIVKSSGEILPPIMDTHYAMPAMHKADEWGIINLEDYPMETWLDPLTEGTFTTLLTQAMQSGKVEMGAVYTALNTILVDEITVDGIGVDLENKNITHSNSHIMVPLRPVAEAMGFDVTWDYKLSAATLANDDVTSTVQVGYDNYFYTSVKAIGMSAPIQVGTTPKLIEGTLYVPHEYFNLFATSSIKSGALSYLMK